MYPRRLECVETQAQSKCQHPQQTQSQRDERWPTRHTQNRAEQSRGEKRNKKRRSIKYTHSRGLSDFNVDRLPVCVSEALAVLSTSLANNMHSQASRQAGRERPTERRINRQDCCDGFCSSTKQEEAQLKRREEISHSGAVLCCAVLLLLLTSIALADGAADEPLPPTIWC